MSEQLAHLSRTNDTLPWEEKYRPQTINQVVGQENVLHVIQRMIASENIPHMLFYGPPGSGKTSTIFALTRSLYGSNITQKVLELNASDNRGMETVQRQIKTFASTGLIFNEVDFHGPQKSSQKFKFVILDEAESMEYTAQMALRRIMDDYTANVRFCIITNQINKLSPALVSRCARFRFRPLSPSAIRTQIMKVIDKENIQIEEEALEGLTQVSKGDMRQALSILQECFSSETFAMETSLTQRSGHMSKITIDAIYSQAITPSPSDIDFIIKEIFSYQNLSSCISYINQIMAARGISLTSIIGALSQNLQRDFVPGYSKIIWLEGLANIEYNVECGGSEEIQTGALVAILRQSRLVVSKTDSARLVFEKSGSIQD